MNNPNYSTKESVLHSSAGIVPAVQHIAGVRSILSRRLYRRLKRVIDLLFVGIVVIPCVILSIPFMILIVLETGRSPIFIQRRGLTANGRIFSMYKFRTMKETAEDVPAGPEGIFLKPHLADRVTRFGRFLRTTGLDELPQILNILFGEMSVIGPRPLSVHELVYLQDAYPELYLQRSCLHVKPGITCFWQLYGNRHNGFADLMYHDMHYVHHCSFNTDLKIFLNTIPLVIFRKHSDSIVESRAQYITMASQ